MQFLTIFSYTGYMQEGIKKDPSLVTKLRATFLKVTLSVVKVNMLLLSRIDPWPHASGVDQWPVPMILCKVGGRFFLFLFPVIISNNKNSADQPISVYLISHSSRPALTED